MNKFMINALGKDRPGMISLVSNILYEQDCNLENVNQMILQKQFAGFFIVQSPDKALIDALPRALAQTQRVCASVNVATARADIGDALINVGVSGPGIINSKTIATRLIPTPGGKKEPRYFSVAFWVKPES